MVNNDNKNCLFKYNTKYPPCYVLQLNNYSYLDDLLADKWNTTTDIEIALKVECLRLNGGYIDIKNENCINCMFCVFGCPGNNIEIKSDYSLRAMCSNFSSDYNDSLGTTILEHLFQGQFIKLPSIKFQQFKVKFKSFQEFTSKDETKNISVWGANTLKFLSLNANPRLGLEIGMKISTRDRGGRLDICLLNNNLLFVAEAKVSFDKMMSEGRYLSQMIAYEEELDATTSGTGIKYFKFLLIGGSESDLLPNDHPRCTSKTGDQSKTFYDSVITNNIYFISANALLSLALLKLFKGDDYSIEKISKTIFKSGAIGLLSSGLVINNGRSIEIIPFDFSTPGKIKYKDSDDSDLSIAAEP